MIEALSERELEIIPLLGEGLSNKEIANRLFLAPSTVKWYVRQLNSKLDTSTREKIVERAEELGLMQSEKIEESYLRPRTNLPYHTTPFVGRDAELEEIDAILNNPDVRLLTILAPGGMGKTRIALEATEQQQSNFKDGVYFVPLQSLTDTTQIFSKIAESIFYRLEGNHSPQEQVLNFLANKQLLLLIDNWEHLLDGASLVNDILTTAPSVKILATSREKLNILGETVYSLRGMTFPTWETPEDALQYDAVQLLKQSAERVKPGWEVTEENLDYVARICRLTQGMPLGILLAMSWLDVLPIADIAKEIEKSVDFLETDLRDVPQRQQSIRTIFNYSWAKLREDEQQVLMKMSVFRGGFSREAAEAVCGANLRTLQSLLSKSLLQMNKDGRYDLHELLRQYAEVYLKKTGNIDSIRLAHLNYFTDLLEEQNPTLYDHRQLETLNSAEQDMGNLQIAWEWGFQHAQWQQLIRMIGPLGNLGELRFHTQIRIGFFVPVLDHLRQINGRDEVQEHLFAKLQIKLIDHRFPEESLELIEHCLQIARKHEETVLVLHCLREMVGFYAEVRRDFDTAEQFVYEAIRIGASTQNAEELFWRYSVEVSWLYLAGQLEKANAIMQDRLQVAKQEGDHYRISSLLTNIAHIYFEQGAIDAAKQCLTDAAPLFYKLGAFYRLAHNHLRMAWLALTEHHLDEVQYHLAEGYRIASELQEPEGMRLYAIRQSEYLFAQEAYDQALELLQHTVQEQNIQRPDHLRIMQVRIGINHCMLGNFYDGIPYLKEAFVSYQLQYQGKMVGYRSLYMILLYICVALLKYLWEKGDYQHATTLLYVMLHHEWAKAYIQLHPYVLAIKEKLHHQLDTQSYQAAWESGHGLDLDQVIADILVNVEDKS